MCCAALAGRILLFPKEFQEVFRECSEIADVLVVSGVLSGIRFLCELFIKCADDATSQTYNNAMKWNQNRTCSGRWVGGLDP